MTPIEDEFWLMFCERLTQAEKTANTVSAVVRPTIEMRLGLGEARLLLYLFCEKKDPSP